VVIREAISVVIREVINGHQRQLRQFEAIRGNSRQFAWSSAYVGERMFSTSSTRKEELAPMSRPSSTPRKSTPINVVT
jgi:hypothetical protein